MKWHKATEKPQGMYPSVVLLTANGTVKFNAQYDGENFCEWGDEWWVDVKEEIVGWLYEKDVEEYLLTLPLDD